MGNNYQAKLHSESVNKWTSEIEDRFDIEASGDTPTKRMIDALDQLHELVESKVSYEELSDFVKKTALTWYKIGSRRGAAEMLYDLMFYSVLPQDIDELRKVLEEPLSEDDSLRWNAKLRLKTHEVEDGNVQCKVKVSYKSILEKLDRIINNKKWF